MKHDKKQEDIQIICSPHLRGIDDSPVCTRGAAKRGGEIVTETTKGRVHTANIQVTFE